jgi:general secretion pathway protein B
VQTTPSAQASAPVEIPAPEAESEEARPESAPTAEAAAPAPSPQSREAPAADREVPSALTQPAPLRKFREMPPEFRADFPALDVQVHVFERAPSQRFVIVNGRRYREGERMVEGPAVIEIVKDGIVIEYRGEKILYTLGR